MAGVAGQAWSSSNRPPSCARPLSIPLCPHLVHQVRSCAIIYDCCMCRRKARSVSSYHRKRSVRSVTLSLLGHSRDIPLYNSFSYDMRILSVGRPDMIGVMCFCLVCGSDSVLSMHLSTLLPIHAGRDKLLINAVNRILITNSGQTILSSLLVTHPGM